MLEKVHQHKHHPAPLNLSAVLFAVKEHTAQAFKTIRRNVKPIAVGTAFIMMYGISGGADIQRVAFSDSAFSVFLIFIALLIVCTVDEIIKQRKERKEEIEDYKAFKKAYKDCKKESRPR